MYLSATGSKVKSVVVLGSPRTGTSFTTSLLHDLGYHVDAGLKDRFNERGYWENFYVVTINDVILNHFGGVLETPPKLPEGWEQSNFVKRLDNHAVGIIAKAKHHESWALKDPRFSLTLPYWKRFLPLDTVFLVCLRRPELAAMSMNRTFGMNIETAVKLWSFYTTQALKNTEGSQRLLIDYDDYYTNFSDLWIQIKETLGITDYQSSSKNFLPTLRHFASPANCKTDIPAEVTRLYEELKKKKKNASANFAGKLPPEYSFVSSARRKRRYRFSADFALLFGIGLVTRTRLVFTRLRV